MSKVAFLFPGQGSQSVGMGKELYEKYDCVKNTFRTASDVLDISMTDLCFNGPEDELRKTFNTQPAILTISTACNLVLAEHGIKADIAAGHSLGEYSALVSANVLTFADAVHIVRKRGQFMQEAVPLGEGAMAAILGLDRQIIIDICKEIELNFGAVQAVNFNCPGQTVIAGTTIAVDQAMLALKDAGAKRAISLPVSAPFHSTLMEPAANKLGAELAKISFNDANIPVVANVTGKIMTSANEIKDLLVKQAASPVLWEDCMAEIVNSGANIQIEVGPGKVLSGFTKKIAKDVISLNIEDVASLEKNLDYFKEVR